MSDRVAQRAGIAPFYVMDVWLAAAERQRTHGDLVNLSAGQPGAQAPAPIRAAAADALANHDLGYTVALGIQELRDEIAASYESRYGVRVSPDDVVVTTGSTGGFLLTFLACFDVGDDYGVSYALQDTACPGFGLAEMTHGIDFVRDIAQEAKQTGNGAVLEYRTVGVIEVNILKDPSRIDRHLKLVDIERFASCERLF